MMKANLVSSQKLLLFFSAHLIFINLSFGGNNASYKMEGNFFPIENVSEYPSYQLFSDEKEIDSNFAEWQSAFMADTVCTYVTTDTFFVNSLEKVDSFLWTVPTGANIITTLGDTMIIVDWTNTQIGLGDICVQTTNDCGISTPVCFPIFVDICNDSPNAVSDQDTTQANLPIIVNVQSNDNDPDNDGLTTSIDPSNNPKNGNLVLIGTNIQYTPNLNFTGVDNFNYIICDDGQPSFCDTAQVIITILPENDAPIAKPDINLTLINTPVFGQVLTNDEDPDGDNLIVSTTPTIQPLFGTVSINTAGIYEYTPSTNFVGQDQFRYQVCDDQIPALCDTTTVTIQVIDPNAKENNPPVGGADVILGIANTPISGNLTSNDFDPDGDPFNINPNPVTEPVNGTLVIYPNGTFDFTPDPDFVGTDEFEYEICDLGSPQACDTVKVFIEIFPNTNNSIFAHDDVVSGEEDHPIIGDLIANDFDPEGNPIQIYKIPIRLPQHGTVTLHSNGSFTYIPVEDYNGSDQFEYEICDNQNPIACDIATAYLFISPVNDTLCKEGLPKPTLLSDGAICFDEELHLFIQENYPLFTIENDTIEYEFDWYNSLGVIMATTSIPNVTLQANNPIIASPFTVKVRGEICTSDFADPLAVNIEELPTIIATSASGSKGVCLNESAQLSATTIDGATYEWFITGNAEIISTEQNPVIPNLTATTTFEVKVKPALCDTFAMSSITVTVNETPTVNPQLANSNAVCEGSSFQLLSNASGTNPLTYNWAGPNGFTSNAANPLIANANADKSGTYTLKVITAGDCSVNGEIAVTNINRAPEKPYINSNSPVCIDGTIEINLQTPYIGNSIIYNWINGQGNTVSTNRNLSLPANDVAAIAPFMLQVTVDGCQAENSDLLAFEIQDTPTALATSDASQVCKNEAVQLFGNEIIGATYEWRILGSPAIISAIQNPKLNNLQRSTDYTLTVSGGICPNKFSIDTISISVSEPVDFTPNRNYTLNQNCSLSELQLTANVNGSNDGLGFRWTGPYDFVSTDENPMISGVTDAFNGNYTLEITDGNGCSTSNTIFINDIQGAVARPVIKALNIGCESENLMLEVPFYEGSGVVYNWFKNGGTLIGLNSSNQLFIDDAEMDAKYHVVIKVGGCILESDTLQPVVLSQPIITIDTVQPALCTDGSEDITINANIQGGQTPYDIVWSGPNGFISYNKDPSLIIINSSLSGTYSINITDRNGCTTQASTVLDITDSPIQPTISLPNAICDGDIITLTAPVYAGVNVQYNWTTPSNQNISGLNTNELIISPTIDSLHNGDYSLAVEIKGCTSSTTTVSLDLVDLPTIQPEAIYSTSDNCVSGNLELKANLSANTNGFVFEWQGPNGFTSNIKNPIIINATAANNGQYALRIMNSAGCTRFIATNIVEGIKESLPQPIIQTSESVCEGGLMTLSAPVYSGNSVAYNWFLNGELIETATTNELTIGPLVANEDEYQLQIQVDDCTLMSNIITPNVLAMANINPSYTLSTLCEGGNLQLMANPTQTVGNVTYYWTGPNGYTFNAENPLISNTSERQNGTYTLTINTLSGCESSKSISVSEIVDEPRQPTVITNSPICSDGMIELSIQQTSNDNPSNYVWINGAGDTIGRERTLSLAPNDAQAIQPYFAKILTADCGEISSIPVRVDIVQIPILPVSNSGPVCEGEEVHLQATDVENGNYIWTDAETGTIISTQQNPTIFNIEKTSTFNLEVQVPGCNNGTQVSTTVTVNEKPFITDLTPSSEICEGQDLILTAINANLTSDTIAYTWTGPIGFNFTAESTDNTFPITIPNFAANQAGTYELTIGVENNCNSDSRSVVIGVSDALITPRLFATANLVCGGESILLTASTENGPAVNYEWYLQTEEGDLFLIRETTTPTMIISNASTTNSGEYVVRVIKDNCNSGYSNTTKITVLDVTTDISSSNNTTVENSICEGGVIQLSVPFFEGASYTWFGPGGFTSDKPNPIINPATTLTAGDYFAVISFEGCSNITSTITTVYVSPKPEIPTIINNGPVCIGESVTLEVSSPINVAEEDILLFEWYNAFSNALIRTTTEPRSTFTNINENNSGGYYLRMSLNGCPTDASNESIIEVLSATDLIANAGTNQNLCAATEVMLTANEITDGVGVWTSLNSATIENPNNSITLATNLQAGINQFVWTANSNLCDVQSADTVNINITALATDVAFAGLDMELCEVNTTNLSATHLTLASGLWTQSNSQLSQGVVITEPTNPNSPIAGIESGNSYTFIWSISQNECIDFDTDTIQMIVNDMPPDNALIREEYVPLCAVDQLMLTAEVPTFSMGQWLTTSSATIADPTSHETFAENLEPGRNVFVWALSNGSCTNYSTDTLVVFSERNPFVNPDEFIVNVDDSLNLTILDNDDISTNLGFDIIITKQPNKGTIIVQADGSLTFKPQSSNFGFDNFQYKICSQTCESLCDSAIVIINIEGSQGSGGCFIPNVISPNGDGSNDFFRVACDGLSPDNNLKIYNRWGDKVYEAQNYQNDWTGTHNRVPLPAGTYFYLLKLSENADPIQGFITIFR